MRGQTPRGLTPFILIVNADDFNLTRGVDRAILQCHDRGIVSSTTFMANLPADPQTVRELKKRKNLGVGIHLNVTFRYPVSKPAQVRSLLRQDGTFKKAGEQSAKPPRASELAAEYAAQIQRFIKIFGRRPTHLDTHHQMHNHPFFLGVLAGVAKKFKLPIRRSSILLSLRALAPMRQYRKAAQKGAPSLRDLKGRSNLGFKLGIASSQKALLAMTNKETGLAMTGVQTTDYFFGNLTPEGHWTRESLGAVLKNLPPGISEIMCHPGIVDSDLRAASSFRAGRAVEHKIFSSGLFRKLLLRHGIVLAHYGVYYCR